MIPIREIDHVVLRVVQLDAMLDFYVQALGCRIDRAAQSNRRELADDDS